MSKPNNPMPQRLGLVLEIVVLAVNSPITMPFGLPLRVAFYARRSAAGDDLRSLVAQVQACLSSFWQLGVDHT